MVARQKVRFTVITIKSIVANETFSDLVPDLGLEVDNAILLLLLEVLIRVSTFCLLILNRFFSSFN
jgi:hypothetical protein